MAAPWKELLAELGERLDEGLLPAVYGVASLDTGHVRAELAAEGLDYMDPATGRNPELHRLDQTAEVLIDRASRTAVVRGAAGSFGGLLMVPPETAAALVQSLRLAQRLAIVYGLDPDTDRGRILLTRALSAAWQVDLPREGTSSLRLRQLPLVIKERLPRRSSRGVTAAVRALAIRAAVTAGKRVGRVIPGFGTAVGAVGARRELLAQGARMKAVYRKAWVGDLRPGSDVLDVAEVG